MFVFNNDVMITYGRAEMMAHEFLATALDAGKRSASCFRRLTQRNHKIILIDRDYFPKYH
jgi:hypothetical protein